jgi:hypothetical protein
MIKFERRSLLLTPQEWQALETLAAKHDACPPSGVTAGQPSWRTLIKRIADGELMLSRPE